MKHFSRLAVAILMALSIAACNGEEAQITTTTLDAALLTTTTTSASDAAQSATRRELRTSTTAQVQARISPTSSDEENLYIS